MTFEPMLENEFAYTLHEVKLDPETEAAVLKLAQHYLAAEEHRAAFNCLAECTTKVQASGWYMMGVCIACPLLR
jgi:thioredoxin-like negative regulator of GroEL